MSRKIKPIHQRKPRKAFNHNELMISISKDTGFTRIDIEMIVNEYLLKVKSTLLDRKSIKLRHVGTLFPIVKPPRRVTNMGGFTNDGNYERMTMKAKWSIGFQVSKPMKKETEDIMVTKRDLDKIYFKESDQK